jgi:heptosyltransferase-3
MNNILVIRPGAIGDTLLTFPVLKALRNQYNDARITLVSNAQVLPLAQAFGVAEETFDFQDIQWSELFSSNGIRTSSLNHFLAQIDLAICWMRDPNGILAHNLKTSGVKHIIIAPGRPFTDGHLHIVDYLAQTIGLPDVEVRFSARQESLSTSIRTRVDEGSLGGPLWSPIGGAYGRFIDDAMTSSDQLLPVIKTHDMISKLFIAIHPGSGAAQKCWPTSRFAEVIKRLWEQKLPVLLLEGPADSDRMYDLLQQLPLPPTPEMFKMLTNAPLLKVAQHLQQSSCYLGNDSGITHLAAMLGVPTIAIFGPTDPKIWRPIGPFVKVLQAYRLGDVTVDEVMGVLI